MIVIHAIASGLLQSLQFFWDSLFGLIFGFLISAIVQVALTPYAMQRYLGPTIRGVLYGAGFGIISSACSYGSAAAARGFYQRGADVRSVFAFLISSTNMNVAILILFWSLLGWKFAFAEFFGGIIIIAVVVAGFSALFSSTQLRELQAAHIASVREPAIVTECPLCAMEGEPEFSVEHGGHTYYACGRKHRQDLIEQYAGATRDILGWTSLAHAPTWRKIGQTAWADVMMLRTELLTGYLLAGFAAALVPAAWLSHTLSVIGRAPSIGYVLLLAAGLAIAIATFVCSMGNVPIARFLANAGIPLGANTSFIYGDLLILPLIAIYRKSFPPEIVWTFIGLFVLGAMLAGAIMEAAVGSVFGGIAMGSMTLGDRLTLISNIIGLIALGAVTIAALRPAATAQFEDR